MALEAQNNPYPSILLVEGDPEALPDADPASGQRRLAVGTDHLLYLVDDSGVKHAVAGSGLSDPMTTRGDVIVRNASNVTARLGRGSAGQVLSSDGTDVSWQTPSGSAGALVLLEQHTAAASSSLDFSSFISSTYDTYVFKVVSLMPATSTALLYMRMGTGGGPTYDSGTNYGSQLMGHNSGVAHFAGADSALNQISLTRAWLSAGNHPIAGTVDLSDPQNTSLFKWVHSQLVYPDSALGNMVEASVSGQYNSTTAVTAVRFLMSSGNITSGKIRVYGVAK